MSASLKELALAAERMPWDNSPNDVPLSARIAFKEAMTADVFLEMLTALEGVIRVADRTTVEFDEARAVVAQVTRST